MPSTRLIEFIVLITIVPLTLSLLILSWSGGAAPDQHAWFSSVGILQVSCGVTGAYV